MIKREEVEAWLADIDSGHYPCVMQAELAELARTWLAVDGAPVVEVIEDDSNSLDRPLTWTPLIIEVSDICTIGQRVKLVLVPEAGGGEG